MKNKIIIFAIVTLLIISTVPLVISAAPHDFTQTGQEWATIKQGEYRLNDKQTYAMQSILNQKDYNDSISLQDLAHNTYIILGDIYFGMYNESDTFMGYKVTRIYSSYFDGYFADTDYQNYYETVMTYSDGYSNHTILWNNGAKDGNIYNESPSDEYVIKVENDTTENKLFYEWFVHNTDYAEVNAVPVYCDGSTCPATDVNFDNLCDDCGSVLTMSLRNTLYDYALWLAESKVSDGYNYYAIFKSSDTYYVHISKSPMTSPDGIALEGDGIMYNRVTQSSDGTNGGSGWYNGFYNSYEEFVEANHTISNFRGALPLAEKILGVTEEQLEETLPKLAGILTILMACGVGCLALLVVLKLFGKQSLISRN